MAWPSSCVTAVDMTEAMIDLARDNAAKGDFRNVEFRLGQIEHLPVNDASVDIIISNCVINLSPEKDRVFREAFRVLKPGGRVLVSDLVWLASPSPEVRESLEALVGCVAGASLKDDYLALMREAGFTDVEVAAQSSYAGDSCCAGDAGQSVVSVKVRGLKKK